MSFLRWQRILLGLSCFFTVFGLAAAVAPHSPLFAFWIEAMDHTFFSGPAPADARALRSFLMGPLGGTIAGSYLLQSFVIAVPFKRRERWAWHAVLWPLLLWFLVDSLLSWAHGAVFNVWMINLVPLVLIGIPLAATKSAFGDCDGGPPGEGFQKGR